MLSPAYFFAIVLVFVLFDGQETHGKSGSGKGGTASSYRLHQQASSGWRR